MPIERVAPSEHGDSALLEPRRALGYIESVAGEVWKRNVALADQARMR